MNKLFHSSILLVVAGALALPSTVPAGAPSQARAVFDALSDKPIAATALVTQTVAVDGAEAIVGDDGRLLVPAGAGAWRVADSLAGNGDALVVTETSLATLVHGSRTILLNPVGAAGHGVLAIRAEDGSWTLRTKVDGEWGAERTAPAGGLSWGHPEYIAYLSMMESDRRFGVEPAGDGLARIERAFSDGAPAIRRVSLVEERDGEVLLREVAIDHAEGGSTTHSFDGFVEVEGVHLPTRYEKVVAGADGSAGEVLVIHGIEYRVLGGPEFDALLAGAPEAVAQWAAQAMAGAGQ